MPKRTSGGPLNGIEPVRHFQLEGRVSVKTEAQNLSGNLAWERAADRETLLLSTPLGQGAAEIRREGRAMVLTGADGSVLSADSDELLLEKALGIRLPLEGLVYWLSALPRPGVAFQASRDEDGRVAALEQDGWRIEYGRYRPVGRRDLPARIFARRGDDLEFRLVVAAWEAR
jgi:outer membrane lipoprotein LolB